MVNEVKKDIEGKKEKKERPQPILGEVGKRPVGPTGIILMTIYLILFSILLLYSIIQLWPPKAGAEGAASTVSFLFWKPNIEDEIRLLLIVALAGALGGLVHTLRSLYWYVGNRELVLSWMIKYILLPFVGTTLALVFYFVIRAGFFTPGAKVEHASPYGFAALAGLVGMFSEQAVLKLKEMAETLLTKPKPGADRKPQE
jgi:hypothetical protein